MLCPDIIRIIIYNLKSAYTNNPRTGKRKLVSFAISMYNIINNNKRFFTTVTQSANCSKLRLHFLSDFNSYLAEIHRLSALINPKKSNGKSIIDKKNDKLIIHSLLKAHRLYLADVLRLQGYAWESIL